MSVPLASFFAAMQPFLEGRASVAETEALLGASPSGSSRFGLYPELVRRQKRSVVDRFFRAARFACDSLDAALWPRLAARFVHEVPSRSWAPSGYASAFPGFLQQLEGADAPPPALVELADYACIRHAVMVAAHGDTADPGLDRSLFVRQYTVDVEPFSREAEAGRLLAGALPALRSSTLLVCRSRKTGKLLVVRPSLAALLVLHRRGGANEELSLPSGIDTALLDAEETALVDRGVLAPWVAAST